MKLKILVRFEGVIGYPNNRYVTTVSITGIDKSECYQNAHQRCMDIVDKIDRDQFGICGKHGYLWLDEEWE